MGLRIVGGLDPNVVQGAAPKTSEAANLVKGIFVSLDSNGELVPATSAGNQRAMGALLMAAQQTDARGNALFVHPQLGYAPNPGIRIDGFTGLTKGAKYYLGTGGGISTGAGALSQIVGVAESTTLLIMHLQPV